jgi:hypothetical protein
MYFFGALLFNLVVMKGLPLFILSISKLSWLPLALSFNANLLPSYCDYINATITGFVFECLRLG